MKRDASLMNYAARNMKFAEGLKLMTQAYKL